MSYYFNGDLEDFLLSEKSEYRIHFNRFNQEFEFFIALLESGPICTNKKYTNEYIDHLQNEFNCELRTSAQKDKARLWCCSLYDLYTQKKVNSRFFTSRIANELNTVKSELIDSQDSLEEGFLYKEDLSVSGMGNYLYPKNEVKLKKILQERPLLKEKFLDRIMDISTLVDGESITHYQNHVDDYFHYKGTLLGPNLEEEKWFDDYQRKLNSLLKENLNIQGVYSIDSFLYRDETGEQQLYFLSEINNRKTMGYVALELQKKYFSDKKFFKSILLPSNKINKEKLEYDQKSENIFLLSPKENLFCFFVVVGDSLNEIKKFELELYARVFN